MEKVASRPGVEVATLISRIREGLTNSEDLHLLSERLGDTHAPSGTGRVAESLQQVIDQPIEVKLQFPWHYAERPVFWPFGLRARKSRRLLGSAIAFTSSRGGAGGE